MNVNYCKLREFLTEKQLSLPVYQRSYDWKPDPEIKDLLDDLNACLSVQDQSYSELFLGTVLLDPSAPSHANGNRHFFIVDGQQRVTTLSIFLIALRNFARDEIKDDAIVNKIQPLLGDFDSKYSNERSPNFEAASNIANVFEYMVHPKWKPPFETVLERGATTKRVKREVNRVKPIYDTILLFIGEIYGDEDIEGINRLTNQLLENTSLIEIILTDQSQASEIFERTNDRGRPLSIADLLKNYLHSQSAEMPNRNIERDWATITDNCGPGIKQMLKFFMVSRAGSVSSRELYRNLKSYAGEVGPDEFVNDLIVFSKFYSAYRDSSKTLAQWLQRKGLKISSQSETEIKKSHIALTRFGILQPIPLLYSVFRAFMHVQNDKLSQHLQNLFQMLESYHFINNKVCSRIGNDVEKLYQRKCENIWKTPSSVVEELEDLREQLNIKLASLSEYSAALRSIRTDKADRTLKYYVLSNAIQDDTIDVFGVGLEAIDLGLLQFGKSRKKTETLLDELPYLALANQKFVNAVKTQSVAEINKHVRELRDQQRGRKSGIVYKQFRTQLDIWPENEQKASDRLDAIAKLSFENIAEKVVGIAFT